MAYCGVLDNLMELNGKPVDLSRLEEGIVIAGDEQFDADELINDEEKRQVFNENAIRTKAELLDEIDRRLKLINKESKDNARHSPEFYHRYKRLIEQFRTEVEKRTFPNKLEDWWEYLYDIHSTGIVLKMSHTSSFDIYADDTVAVLTDTVFTLLRVKTKLLTVEQFAQAYGVTATTVRQWIRRGKIRTAIKQGSEWRIPELAEIMERGYTSGHYARKEFLTDLPSEYAFFNDYDYVDIRQNEKHKELYDLCFSKKFDSTKIPREEWDKYYKEIQLDQKEREKFELYLISSPFVESSEE